MTRHTNPPVRFPGVRNIQPMSILHSAMVSTSWIFVNVIGNGGVSFILVAYVLLTAGLVTPEAWIYLLLNVVGSLMIIASLMFQFNLPSMIIEVCWVLISLYGISRLVYTSCFQHAAVHDSGAHVEYAQI